MKDNPLSENSATSKINCSQPVYRSKSFSFMVEDVWLPNGRRTEMALVRHPGSTAIVPFLDEDTILLLRQYRHPIGKFIYEIPSGTMDPGETDPLACAKRELEEETGYRAGEFISMGHTYILPSYSDEKIHLFIARDLTATAQNLDEDEIIEVEKTPLVRALEMIDSGEINDALTGLVIQRAWRWVQSGGN
jgi:ADP-ribose diphosphatase